MYSKVKDNKKSIKEYIKESLNNLHELDNNLNIEFNYDVISADDYFYFEPLDITKDSNYLYYYDNDEHILYWLRF